MVISFLSGRKHSRLRGLLSSYIDGQVSESETRQVESHLRACKECSLEIELLRATVGLIGDLPLLETLRPFTLTEVPAPVTRARTMVWTTRLATSAAAVLLVALLLGDSLGILAQSGVPQEGIAASAAPALAAPSAPVPVAAMAAPSEAVVESAAAEMSVRVVTESETIVEEEELAPVAEAEIAPVAAMAAPAPESQEAAAATQVEMAEAALEEEMTLVAQALQALDEAEARETSDSDAAIAASPAGVENPSTEAVAAPQTGVAPTPEHLLARSGNEIQPADATSGIDLPLWQLEAAVAILLLVLGLVMLRVARRDRRPLP